MKRLYLDIETSPIEAYVWSLYPDYIGPHQIKEDWKIICAGWLWDGEKKVHTAAWKRSKDGSWDDSEVCEKIAEAINEADQIVYHNGDRFDFIRIHLRLLKHDLDPLPNLVKIDTRKQAKKHFGFTSNKLDYIAQYLGLGNKIKTEFDLWVGCVNGDQTSLDKMLKYNIQDVKLLQDVHHYMEPYIDLPKGAVTAVTAGQCPACHSTTIQKRGYSYTQMGKYQRYQCQDCGKWHRSGKNLIKGTSNLLR